MKTRRAELHGLLVEQGKRIKVLADEASRQRGEYEQALARLSPAGAAERLCRARVGGHPTVCQNVGQMILRIHGEHG